MEVGKWVDCMELPRDTSQIRGKIQRIQDFFLHAVGNNQCSHRELKAQMYTSHSSIIITMAIIIIIFMDDNLYNYASLTLDYMPLAFQKILISVNNLFLFLFLFFDALWNTDISCNYCNHKYMMV